MPVFTSQAKRASRHLETQSAHRRDPCLSRVAQSTVSLLSAGSRLGGLHVSRHGMRSHFGLMFDVRNRLQWVDRRPAEIDILGAYASVGTEQVTCGPR